MSKKILKSFNRTSYRLKNWDYGNEGAYFITICTKDREHFFGEIENGEMVRNDIGKIAENEWLKTFEMRPDMNLEIGEFVIMPNHFHAIIGIGKNEYNTHIMGRDAMHCDPTHNTHCDPTHNTHCDPTHNTHGDAMHYIPTTHNIEYKNKFGPQSKNLASIIRGFKIGVTRNARILNPGFAWQSLFHDHIIRNEESFQRISEYIINNPSNWMEDTFCQ